MRSKRRSVRRNTRRRSVRRNTRRSSVRKNTRRRSVRKNTRRRSVRKNTRRNTIRRKQLRGGSPFTVINPMLDSHDPSILCVTWNVGENTSSKLTALCGKLQRVVDEKSPELIVISLQESVDGLSQGDSQFGFDGYGEAIILSNKLRKMPHFAAKFRLAIVIFKKEDYNPYMSKITSNIHNIGLDKKHFFKGFLTVDVTIGKRKFKFVSLHLPFVNTGVDILKKALINMFSKTCLGDAHIIFMGDFNSRILLTSECAVKNSEVARLCSETPCPCKGRPGCKKCAAGGSNSVVTGESVEYCKMFDRVKQLVSANPNNLVDVVDKLSNPQPIGTAIMCNDSEYSDKYIDFFKSKYGLDPTVGPEQYGLKEINLFLEKHDFFATSFHSAFDTDNPDNLSPLDPSDFYQPLKVGPFVTYKFDGQGQLVSSDASTTPPKSRLMGEPDKFVCYSQGGWPYEMVSCNVDMDAEFMNDHVPVMAYMRAIEVEGSPVGGPTFEVEGSPVMTPITSPLSDDL